MMKRLRHVRHGMSTVRPYVHGHLDLWDLLQDAFDAKEIERYEFAPAAFHIEAQIGDSIVVIETGDPPPAEAPPSSVCVYVSDVDSTYARAVKHGAKSLSAPEDKPSEERQASVRDSFGNTWWISTYHG